MGNKEDRAFDRLLSEAFREQYKKELNSSPSDDSLEAVHPFGDEQMKRATELSRRHKNDAKGWRTSLNRVAAVVICIAMGSGIIAMTNPTVRGNVAHAVTHWIDEYIAIDFAEAADGDRIDITKTRITYMPEGFKVAEDNSDDDSISLIYENSEGDFIIVDIEQSSDINLMTDDTAHDTDYQPINGYEGYISYSDELGQGSVYFGSSYFTVAISGMTERDELIKIAENIVFKD